MQKLSYFHFRTTKISNSLIWKKKMPKSEMQKKNVPRAGVGKNFNFFDFSKSFQNWRKLSYFHFRTTKISKFTHLEEKDAKEWNAKKMSLGPGWAKTSIFSIFRKVFKTEGNYHIFTLGQLKYQNSLIWKKKMPKSEMQKKCP